MSWCDHGHCTICNTEQEIARLRAALQATAARRFPLQEGPSLPWEMIAPYEAQAQANHGQSLERLAERGGLSPGEALAVLTCRRRPPMSIVALAEIERRRVEWEDNELRAQLRAAWEALAARDAEIATLREDLERERLRLVACGDVGHGGVDRVRATRADGPRRSTVRCAGER